MKKSEDKKTEKKESSEEKKESKEGPQKNIGSEKKIEKQLIKIFAFFIALVIVFVIAFNLPKYYIKKANQFEYEGLQFEKVQVEGLPFYKYSLYFNDKGKIHQYNLYLRIDPRKNKVPVEGEINLGRNDFYIGIANEDLSQCPDGVIASAGLAQFLTGNKFKVRVGDISPEVAEEKEQEWIACTSVPFNTAIELVQGDETKIISSGDCFKIIVNNCEVLNATEKFIVQAIIDTKEKQ